MPPASPLDSALRKFNERQPVISFTQAETTALFQFFGNLAAELAKLRRLGFLNAEMDCRTEMSWLRPYLGA